MDRIREETIINKIPIPIFWNDYVRKGEDILEKKAVICPWHDDHRPSLVYNPDKKYMKCYSCGAGGSIIDIAMLIKKLSREDAILFLKDTYSIDSGNYTVEDIQEMVKLREKDTNLRLSESKLIMIINSIDILDAYILLDLVMSLDLDIVSKTNLYNSLYKEVIEVASTTRDFTHLIRRFCCNDLCKHSNTS